MVLVGDESVFEMAREWDCGKGVHKRLHALSVIQSLGGPTSAERAIQLSNKCAA